MKMLSVGLPSTLGNWRDLCAVTFGPTSRPVRFFDEKIAKESRDAEVIADESQLLMVCLQMVQDDAEKPS